MGLERAFFELPESPNTAYRLVSAVMVFFPFGSAIVPPTAAHDRLKKARLHHHTSLRLAFRSAKRTASSRIA
jgi:hypothetical protein